MDLQALCDGSYEDALAFIEKVSTAPDEGMVKVADGIWDTIKGYGNSAGDWLKEKGNDIANSNTGQRIGNWWGGLPEAARLGIAGAGIGAGVGGLGSLAFGGKNKSPLYGAGIGAMLGGAGMGGYGLLKGGTPPMGKSPAEDAAAKAKDVSEKKEQQKLIDEAKTGPEGTIEAVPKAIEQGHYGTAARMIPGLGGMWRDGGLLPDGANDVTIPFTGGGTIPLTTNRTGLDTTIATGAVDMTGKILRQARPLSADVRQGLTTEGVDKFLPADLKGKGADIAREFKDSDIGTMNPLRRTSPMGVKWTPSVPGLGSLPIPFPRATSPLGLTSHSGAVPAMPAPPLGSLPLPPLPAPPSEITPDALKRIGQLGQKNHTEWHLTPRFAGTPLPRWGVYPATQILNHYANVAPHLSAENARATAASIAASHASNAAMPPDQLGKVVAGMGDEGRDSFFDYVKAHPESRDKLVSSFHPEHQLLFNTKYPPAPAPAPAQPIGAH